jgi:glyoxylase-like metal-dependent hydrolase (beta-lactamase superfamily II)
MDEIAEGFYRLGDVRLPAFLVAGRQRAVLIDAGPAWMGPIYLADIRRLPAAARGPDALLLTHLHFDHVGGAPFLRRHFPAMELAAGAVLKEHLTRPGVLETLARLNRDLADAGPATADLMPGDFDYGGLKVDRVLANGEIIDLGGDIVIEALATPGHTRDSFSFFLPHVEAVVAGEALGIIPGDDFWVAPEFLSGYDEYLRSIDRIRRKNPGIIATAHHRVLTGADAGRFFDAAIADCRAYRRMIEQHLLEAGMDQARVVRRIAATEYRTRRQGKQPEAAFLLNLTAQVRLIAREMKRMSKPL